VVVSDRVSLPAGDANNSAAGLEVALRPVLQHAQSVWLGWSGIIAPADRLETHWVRHHSVRHNNIEYVLTDLSRSDFEEYCDGFANRVLWPILHYRLDLVDFSRHDLAGYFTFSKRFATELSKLIGNDDLIWVHDYYLIPLADALRKSGCANRIGFFLHVPFPPPEILTALPRHEQLIPLLMQYDVVGFQTESDAGNFVRYLISEREDEMRVFETAGQVTVSSKGRQTLIGAFPVGIETNLFARLARRNVRSRLVRTLLESLGGRNLVIGVDRLDYSKGLIERFDAFDMFLAEHSEWLGKVTYLQITPTNRSEIPDPPELEKALNSAAGRINGKYGEVSWTPIRYVNRAYGRAMLAGLYRTARVGLVTPLCDGMNLVAKEYVAAQDPDDPGVLILSRFAGAANEFRRALLVNPYDAESVAAALAQALAMPLPERRARHKVLYTNISEHDVERWRRDFLKALCGDQQEMANPSPPEKLRLGLPIVSARR
jgi:trehalose 6-phosphate synthase